MKPKIVWDKANAAKHYERHGVPFADAQYVFQDRKRKSRFSRYELHQGKLEPRFVMVGKVTGQHAVRCGGDEKGIILLVVYTPEGKGRKMKFRMISARPAHSSERRLIYGEQ